MENIINNQAISPEEKYRINKEKYDALTDDEKFNIYWGMGIDQMFIRIRNCMGEISKQDFNCMRDNFQFMITTICAGKNEYVLDFIELKEKGQLIGCLAELIELAHFNRKTRETHYAFVKSPELTKEHPAYWVQDVLCDFLYHHTYEDWINILSVVYATYINPQIAPKPGLKAVGEWISILAYSAELLNEMKTKGMPAIKKYFAKKKEDLSSPDLSAAEPIAA